MAEIEVMGAPAGAPCMAIVGRVRLPSLDVWAERRWSGTDPTAVHCGALSTVDLGFNACDEHGSEALAQAVRRAMIRAGRNPDIEPDERVPFVDFAEWWERDGNVRRWYPARQGGSSFSAQILELGINVADPLWASTDYRDPLDDDDEWEEPNLGLISPDQVVELIRHGKGYRLRPLLKRPNADAILQAQVGDGR